MDLNSKHLNLKKYLKSLKRVLVAFSSGVDSTFLLKTAHDVLSDNVIAVTAKSDFFPKRELEEAVDFCKEQAIRHIVVDIDIDTLSNNSVKRCYICKKRIFSKFLAIAKENNVEYVLEGSNVDDQKDYRPGMQAIEELGIESPLRTIGFCKDEIRVLSSKIGLKTSDKSSFACLASRFVYEEPITKEKLLMVERSEQLLFDLGFKQFRVRIHSNIARIEVLPYEFEKLLNSKNLVVSQLKKFGFQYVTMDLTGYRTGSMNETIKIK